MAWLLIIEVKAAGDILVTGGPWSEGVELHGVGVSRLLLRGYRGRLARGDRSDVLRLKEYITINAEFIKVLLLLEIIVNVLIKGRPDVEVSLPRFIRTVRNNVGKLLRYFNVEYLDLLLIGLIVKGGVDIKFGYKVLKRLLSYR